MASRFLTVILSGCLAVFGTLSAESGQPLRSTQGATGVESSANCGRSNGSGADGDFVCGDANGDELISLSDPAYLISFLYEEGPPPESKRAGDPDGNGTIDLADVAYLIAYLYKGGPAPEANPFSITIVDLQPGDNTVHGTAEAGEVLGARVVLWAKTDRWYVQPSIANPYTIVRSDGTWSSFTYPWDRMVALLVDSTYEPGSVRDYHPALDAGVICFDEYPEKSVRQILWSEYLWRVKAGDMIGPGPNYFSDGETNVWVDQKDRLHLKYDYRDNRWYCAEVVLDHSLGYGVYTFKLDSRVDNLDYNTTFAGFIYETINQEFDMEFSQRLVTDSFDAQYVAQPWYTPGNIEVFKMSVGSQTSHSFEWRPNQIICHSWNGHADYPTPATLIHTWTYTGDDIPQPGGERMRFNLYLHSGDPPVEGTADEVVIESFDYTNRFRMLHR